MSYPNFSFSHDCCSNCVGSTGATGPQGLPGEDGAGIAVAPDHIVVGSGEGIMDSGVPLSQLEGAISDEIQVRQLQVNALNTRIDGIGTLGFYVGAFDNFAEQQAPGNTTVPTNVAQFAGSVSLNDFITVRQDETHDGASTRYVIMGIDGGGNITWGYDITYSTDITGKMDKITPPAPGNLVMQDDIGNATDAGVSALELLNALGNFVASSAQLFGPFNAHAATVNVTFAPGKRLTLAGNGNFHAHDDVPGWRVTTWNQAWWGTGSQDISNSFGMGSVMADNDTGFSAGRAALTETYIFYHRDRSMYKSLVLSWANNSNTATTEPAAATRLQNVVIRVEMLVPPQA